MREEEDRRRLAERAVRQTHIATAAELFAALSPQTFPGSAAFSTGERWVFRGVASSRYRLIPSVSRMPEPWASWQRNESPWSHMQHSLVTLPALDAMAWEQRALRMFLERADRCGLRLPEDSQAARRQLQRRFGPVELSRGAWPPLELLSPLALAQHYGVPTRLLDWSYDSRVAMYFAAQEPAAEELDMIPFGREASIEPFEAEYLTGPCLALWCFNLEFINAAWGEPEREPDPPQNATPQDLMEYLETRRTRPPVYLDTYEFGGQSHLYLSENPRVEVVTAPYDAIPNLAAQRGLFTLDRAPHAIPFDEAVKARAVRKRLWHQPGLMKFTMPRAETAKLLRMLRLENISSATMLPGYRGVAESLREWMLVGE